MAVQITPDQEIWVMTTEGSKITGYNRQYLEQLARKNLSLPEDERLLKVRMRARRYELWLPDLLRYIEEIGNGPHQDKKWSTRESILQLNTEITLKTSE